MSGALVAARDGVLEQARDPSPGPWFADAAIRSVGRAIGHDGYCLFAVDPLTGARASMFCRNGLETPTERLVHNETVERDANRYADLARAPRHAGVLSAAQRQHSRSPRLHDILRDEGYRSELRLALVSGGRYWGALSLFRGGATRCFDELDAENAHELGYALSLVIRRYEVRWPRTSQQPPPDGTVLFDATGRVVHTSVGAREWLVGLSDSWEQGASEEDVLRVVREVADAAAGRRTGPALCRSRLPDGRWLVVSGVQVGGDGVDVAVVLRAGDLTTVAPAFAAWCGLSARETAVLTLVARGLVARQVARRLGLSPFTVDDHLRAIYRKAGVHGKDELLAAMT